MRIHSLSVIKDVQDAIAGVKGHGFGGGAMSASERERQTWCIRRPTRTNGRLQRGQWKFSLGPKRLVFWPVWRFFTSFETTHCLYTLLACLRHGFYTVRRMLCARNVHKNIYPISQASLGSFVSLAQTHAYRVFMDIARIYDLQGRHKVLKILLLLFWIFDSNKIEIWQLRDSKFGWEILNCRFLT